MSERLVITTHPAQELGPRSEGILPSAIHPQTSFHALSYSMFDLADRYSTEGMTAYVDLQEREFAAEARGYTATRHQREVSTGYFDDIATVLNSEGFHRVRPVLILPSTAPRRHS